MYLIIEDMHLLLKKCGFEKVENLFSKMCRKCTAAKYLEMP